MLCALIESLFTTFTYKSIMARISVSRQSETHVSGAGDNSLNAGYSGAVALTGATLVAGSVAAGAPAIGVIGGLGLASGLAYAGCEADGRDPLALFGDDESEKTNAQASA